jgi:hypothetical protein
MYACIGRGVCERTQPRIPPTKTKVIVSQRLQPAVFLCHSFLSSLAQIIGQLVGKLNKRVVSTTNEYEIARVYMQLRAHTCSLNSVDCGRYIGP